MADPLTKVSCAAVLLPSGRMFDRLYNEGIAPCCVVLELRLDRVPAEVSRPGVIEDTLRRIGDADSVIADVTGGNSGVLYFAGIARALGKPGVLLALHEEDSPFAQGEYPLLVHAGDSGELRRGLPRLLRETAGRNASPASCPASGGAVDAPSARFMEIFGDLLAGHGYEHRGTVKMENERTFVIEEQEMELALVQALARRAREKGLRLKLL